MRKTKTVFGALKTPGSDGRDVVHRIKLSRVTLESEAHLWLSLYQEFAGVSDELRGLDSAQKTATGESVLQDACKRRVESRIGRNPVHNPSRMI